MYDSMVSIFSTNNSEQNALLLLLVLSFALGVAIWAILVHYPAHRKSQKKYNATLDNNKKLQKEHQSINERHTVINAKYDRQANEIQNLEATLKAKIQKNTEQQDTIKMIRSQLELYKDHARNFKESKEKLTQEFQRLVEDNKKNELKSNELIQLVEALKKEKNELQDRYNLRENQYKKNEKQQCEIGQEIEKQKQIIQLLQQDLEQVQLQKSKFKKMVYELEAAEPIDKSSKRTLLAQINDLKAHVLELEIENADLMKRMLPFVALEKDHGTANTLSDEFLDQVLEEAAKAMNKGGLYSNIASAKLIEDQQYLSKTLQEIKAVVTTKSLVNPKVILTQTEEADFAEAFQKASLALQEKGFYQAGELPLATNEPQESVAAASKQATRNLNNKLPNQLEQKSHEDFIEKKNPSSITKEKPQNKNKNNIAVLEASILEAINTNIGPTTSTRKDNLKRIDGIGSFVEQQLNQFGIFRFEQISQFTPDLMHKLGLLLGFSEDTISRDKWVEQAGILAN